MWKADGLLDESQWLVAHLADSPWQTPIIGTYTMSPPRARETLDGGGALALAS